MDSAVIARKIFHHATYVAVAALLFLWLVHKATWKDLIFYLNPLP